MIIIIAMDGPLVVSNKSCKTYFQIEGGKVYFTGDFDSGNLQKVQQLNELTYRLTPGFDKTRQSTNKTYFHFKTQGFKSRTAKFIINRAYILDYVLRESNPSELYHPVVRKGPQLPWEKLKNDVKVHYNSADQPQLVFQYAFDTDGWVQFAFTYPFSYQDNEALIRELQAKYSKHEEIYFHQQVMTRTSEHRKVHLLTLTARNNVNTKEREAPVEGIFGEDPRPFKINKPRVIISARVHPGESPASHCLEGMLRFLTNEKDYRSYLLRKHFHFMIVPMLNPEGVHEGMFRNDMVGENLNRMYVHCDPKKHKSIWAVTRWVESLERVDFFFDLHAHPSRKGFFIYGNAFEEFLEQTEAQIFSKIIEYNCPYFQNLDCIYSQKAMSAKERYDNHSKEGCARVYYHRRFSIIHSYTVECGYFGPTKLNPFPPMREHPIPGSDYECTRDWEEVSKGEYSPNSYRMLGKSLLISIIDLFHINPYTRIGTSDFKSINSLRKYTAQKVYNEVERFRLVDSNCYRKIRDVARMIEEEYYIPRFKHYGLNISENYGMKYRKKTFAINTRLYPTRSLQSLHSRSRVNESHQVQPVSNNEEPAREAETSRDASVVEEEKFMGIHINSFSEQSLTTEVSHQSFSTKLLKKTTEMNSKLQHLRQQRQESPKNRPGAVSTPTLKSVQLTDKDTAFSPLLREKPQPNSSYRKLQNEIINELLRSKLRKEAVNTSRKAVEGIMKIDRLGSFLRKQAKPTLKLPAIHGESRSHTPADTKQ